MTDELHWWSHCLMCDGGTPVSVAQYVPVSPELLADTPGDVYDRLMAQLARGVDDGFFYNQLGRGRLVDVGAERWFPWFRFLAPRKRRKRRP